MAEMHSKGEQRHHRIAAAGADTRTAMTRAGDSLPFRPYVYRGGEIEPAAVTAARERHRALDGQIARRNAALAAEEIMPDGALGPEWYRELACDE